MTENGATLLDDRLRTAGWLFAAGSALHVADHLRRGQGSISEELYVLGNVALVLQVVIVVLLVTGHRTAPHWAAYAGYPLALGFLAAHWLPRWSVLSDPVWEVEVWTGVTWAASALEIVGALGVALLGTAALRRTAAVTVSD